jgi:hypothetical protein
MTKKIPLGAVIASFLRIAWIRYGISLINTRLRLCGTLTLHRDKNKLFEAVLP